MAAARADFAEFFFKSMYYRITLPRDPRLGDGRETHGDA
jgi:hypothetical protein